MHFQLDYEEFHRTENLKVRKSLTYRQKKRFKVSRLVLSEHCPQETAPGTQHTEN